MFGKSRHERRDLAQHGRHARAVVVEISERGFAITHGADTVVTNTEVTIKTRLRVEPDGEPPFEVHQRFRYPQLSVPSVGSRLTVLFDPDDHDNIVIDRSGAGTRMGGTDMAALLRTVQGAHPADPTEFAHTVMDQLGLAPTSAATVIVGGHLVGGSGPAAAGTDPVDRLEKLARLRDSGVLTEEEFQTQKARILRESA